MIQYESDYLMKKIYFIFIIFGLILAGCNLKQNYTMQYGFSNEIIPESKFEETSDGFKLKIPFADFGCEIKKTKAVLERKEKTFTITIFDNQAAKRCSEKFFAEVTGIPKGEYWLKVIYLKETGQQEVFSQVLVID